MIALGIHGGVTIHQHDPGAALVIDGKVVAVCEEERYTRIKQSRGHFPTRSIRACLRLANIRFEDIDVVVSPGETYKDYAAVLESYLRHTFGGVKRIELVHHQLAHLAGAFYGSDFDEAACLSLDGFGDGLSGVLGRATRKGGIEILERRPTSNSLGTFYELLTSYLGFDPGDEYKVMGLAPYGRPIYDLSAITRVTTDNFDIDQTFFRSDPPLRSPFEPQFGPSLPALLGQPRRLPGSELTTFYKDVAASAQAAFEACLSAALLRLNGLAPSSKLVLSGGCALNCTAVGQVITSGQYDDLYVGPGSSDRGLPLGCAYLGAAMLGDTPQPLPHAYMGSEYGNDSIRSELIANGIAFRHVDDVAEAAAKLLDHQKIIGWHQGRSECGARALGSRSILASAADPGMKDKLNARIKFREEFRPFAPAVLAEEAHEVFDMAGHASPFMTATFQATETWRSRIPSVVHVDGSSRVQTVAKAANPLFHELLNNLRALNGQPLAINTSFNVKDQAIVETPRDALMTFFGCGLDALVVGNFVVEKAP